MKPVLICIRQLLMWLLMLTEFANRQRQLQLRHLQKAKAKVNPAENRLLTRRGESVSEIVGARRVFWLEQFCFLWRPALAVATFTKM